MAPERIIKRGGYITEVPQFQQALLIAHWFLMLFIGTKTALSARTQVIYFNQAITRHSLWYTSLKAVDPYLSFDKEICFSHYKVRVAKSRFIKGPQTSDLGG